MRICVFPGSFDPFTLGHLDVARRAAGLFDKVYVAIMQNSEKVGMFDFSRRKMIAEVSCAGLENVEVIAAQGLLVDLVAELGAAAVVKGVRNEADFGYEMMLAGINRHLGMKAETVFIPTSAEYSFVCSAFARELIRYGRGLEGVLHPDAIELIKNG
ncbi:MAG: pantetheine-phosphate adenylyltransferase [Clostridiales bacterium]|nr:pantetheine-phosphate adenylyltransferase [Clostridiales bacterium]HOA84971.1 pantetheine-phosphate adenylyltransferase [Bacillota bacterium]